MFNIDFDDNYHEALKSWYRAYRSAAVGKANQSTDPRTIANQMKGQLTAEARRYGTTFTVADLEVAMAAVHQEEQAAAAKQAITRLAYKPEYKEVSEQQLAKFASILLYREASLVELAVLKQFIWLVKRHLADLPAYHHIMPVVVGSQGSGKTETIKRLIKGSGISPDLCLSTTFSYLEDERNTPALSKHYIVFLDEMAKASRSDVNNLKRIITESTLTYRPMRTNEERKLKNNVTLIGASNQSIVELIKDYTGMRRYYELIVADVSKLNLADKNRHWRGLNEVDFELIWKGVDERADYCEEFVANYESINAEQTEQLAASNMFLEFIAHKNYTPHREGFTIKENKLMIDVLKEYKDFLFEHGSFADNGIDPKGLARKFRDAGFITNWVNNKNVVLLAKGAKLNKIEMEGGK